MKKNNIFLVNIKILNKSLNQSFTYMIDSSLYNIITYTDLVLIEFNSRFEIGMVINKYIQEEELTYKPKNVYKVLKQNRISSLQLQLINSLEAKTYNNKEDLINLILKKNTVNNNILEVVVTNNNNIKLNNKFKQFINKDNKILYKSLSKDLKREVISLMENKFVDIILKEKETKDIEVYKIKEEVLKENIITLQKEILTRYLKKKDLLEYYNITSYSYNKLKKLNLLDFQKVNKNEYKSLEKEIVLQKINLTKEQEIAYSQVTEIIDKKPILLHGVTGSGKTSIFIKLIESEIKKEKQVLILVPEITLSVQMIQTLTSHFGDICAFFNTALTQNEHEKLLNKVNKQDVKIVISTRSGVFLNIPKLELVIIDEEHDASYKQNFYPYYHVDDIVEFWQNQKVKVLYSSATPRLITYAKAQRGVYGLSTLTQRYNNYTLPDIVLKEYDQENIVNKEFINIIEEQVNKQQNVLILFNVKGYSKSVECHECGNIETCPHCNLPMKYFKKTKTVECSYCDFKINNYTCCSKCSNTKLTLIGLGIEQIQEKIEYHFKRKVLRIDSQIAKTKEKVNSIIKQFNDGKGNILIGTQIIAKGLNFKNLNQVMVLNTDNMLYFNDFSSYETAYQLLEQVSGRSGRNKEHGKVYIYTNHKDNFIYEAVKMHDYLYFYTKEMENRKLQKSLPYYYICQIEFRHKDIMKYEEQIQKLKLSLENHNLIVTKVVQPYLEQIGEQKRLKLFIKYRKENIKKILNQEIVNCNFGTCKVLIDLSIMNYGF